jgi:methionyl-tRNA formyltransferase
MRLVFVGAVETSRVGFEALVAAGLRPDLLVTLPPSLSGNHSDFADLAACASRAGVVVHFTSNVNERETMEAVRAVQPDLCLVIGWSQLCRKEFLSIARIGTIGFHPAPLPRMRGRAVIPWTILLDETETGSSLFWIDEGTDSGPILLQRLFPVCQDETSKSLYEKHAANLAQMLPEAVRLALSDQAPRIIQDDSLATYCAKRTADDGLIEWREPAEAVLRLIRAAGTPYPGAFTFSRGERLILDAAAPSEDSDRYVGLPGQVQNYRGEGFVVRCGDGKCIDVKAWRSASGKRPRMHDKLGSTGS